MRTTRMILLALLVGGVATASSETGSPAEQVALRLDHAAGLNRLWVDTTTANGETVSRLVRATRETIALEGASAGSSGGSAFARWTEAGATWGTFSLDGGLSWSVARPWSFKLELRDGSTSPRQRMPQPEAGLALGPEGRVFIVQLESVSLPAFRDALERAGASVLAFFPHNAHLVRVDRGALDGLRRLDFVGRVEPFHPSYRLEHALRAWLLGSDGPPTVRVRVQAFEWGVEGKALIADLAHELGASVDTFTPSGHVLELTVDRDQLRRIAAHDDVSWIDRWSPPEDDMDLVREDAGTNWVETNFGWCGQGVRGEVLDSGIQSDHPDFDGVLLHGSFDVSSHGTSTYGIVFGNGDRDGDGEAKATGHMPCAEQGIFADYGFLTDRFVHTQELKDAPYFASFQTNSWGSAQTPVYTSVSAEMDDIVWRLDIAILQSQSNTGNQNSRPQAWGKNMIAVGGIKHEDTLDTADDSWTGGASIGPAEDGRIKPDVSYWYDDIYTTTTGSGYTAGFGGTSAATPESAGVLGLMVQMWSENVWSTDPSGNTVFERQPHFSTMKALLINNAQQYTFSGAGHDLTRVHQGWGRPSARLAQERAINSVVVDEEYNLEISDVLSFNVDVLPGETELKVTLVYPDPPGTTAATLHRINDVDLQVTSPSGSVYHGNVGLDVGNYSTAGGGPNGVDTVENVFIQNPEAGAWAVEIEAVEINQDAVLGTPEDDVTFALVITGADGSVCDGPQVSFTVSSSSARVGEPLLFDSTVSGGAGGPYVYAWDFDNDGTTDSTDVDPVYAYPRPYDGVVKLKVRDVASCPERATDNVQVTGPDLYLDGVLDLTEIDGNFNGAVDPGEVWDFRLRLRNDGSEDALGVRASIADASTAGTASVVTDLAMFPDIPVGATGESIGLFRFEVSDDFVCGNDALFDMIAASSEPANTYSPEPAAVIILVGGSGAPVAFHQDTFESDTGWAESGGGEWQFAAPQGLGGQQSIPGQTPKPDPTSAAEGSFVMGNDLTGLGQFPGAYEADITSSTTSPPLDASGAKDVELRFQRWLNTDLQDTTTLEVSTDGINWTTLFSDPGDFTEQQWTEVSYDIAAIADGEPAVRVRFGIVSDLGLEQGGWNIDDLRLFGVTRDSCEPFTQTRLGEAYALQIDRGAVAGELDLSWGGDCGSATTFAVYRGDLAAGYASIAQEPGRCAVAGTTTSVPEGPGSTDFFLVVPNDGLLEGSYGAATAGPRGPAAAACYPEDNDLANCAP